MSRPIYLIRDSGREDLLFLPFARERVLPVFSFEAEARMFLQFSPRGAWRVESLNASDFRAALARSRPAVRRLVLDPLPAALTGLLRDAPRGAPAATVSLPGFERVFARKLPATGEAASGLCPEG